MDVIDWIGGDIFAMTFPAHPDALHEGGAEFLTRAFHRSGVLSPGNSVARITRFEDCGRGSTGRKVLLCVEYARPEPGLDADLFVKFSRDFTDPLRDRQRHEMEREARFAALSREAGFPVEVATCYFAEFHAESGTGILITRSIPYGQGNIEAHHEKCLDWQMPDQLGHYRALVKANARLAGAHRAGLLPPSVALNFPFDVAEALAADPIRHDARQLGNRVARFADFCAAYPALLPGNVRTPAFHETLARDIPRFLEHERTIKQWLYEDPDYIVFCHWNANVDNAWFWSDDAGERHCGLIDWGRVGQMSVASALWGSLSGAETALWDAHLDGLLMLFRDEFAAAGGVRLDHREIRLRMDVLVGLLGVCWLLDAVPLILREVPDMDAATDRFDPRLTGNERARTQLHMLTVFMNMWQTHDLGRSLDHVLERTACRQVPA